MIFPLVAAATYDTLAVTVPFDPVHRYYAATFTDSQGNTSELGNCFRPDPEQETVILTLTPGNPAVASGLIATLLEASSRGNQVDVFVTSEDHAYSGNVFEDAAAVSPNGLTIVPQSISGAMWQMIPVVPVDSRYALCLSIGDLSEEEAEEAILVARGPTGGGVWRPFDTHLEMIGEETHACTNDLTFFGQYALGSGKPAVLAAPRLLSPLNGAVGQSQTPTMEWQAVPDIGNYEIQLALDPAFGQIAYETALSGVTWTLEDALPGAVDVYWRVRATTTENVGPWSSSFRFTTEGPPVTTEPNGETPASFALTAIYPNPILHRATVEFETPNESNVRIEMFDLLGRRVAMLVDETLSDGRHSVQMNVAHLASGIYLIRMQAGSFADTRRVTVVR